MWSIFTAPRIAAIEAILGAVRGPVGVIGDPAVVRGLRVAGREVVLGLDGASAGLAAVVLAEPPSSDALAIAAAATRTGGAIVWMSRGRGAELAGRALCAGLTEVGQRTVGWTRITHGRVHRLG